MAGTFALAGLLRVRKLRESIAAGTLQTANQSLNAGSRRLDSLTRRAAQADEPIHDASTLMAVAAGRASSRSMLAEHLAHMRILQEQVAKASAEHSEAKREVKVVEKLEERHALKVQEEDLAAEQRIIDEAASRLNQGENTCR